MAAKTLCPSDASQTRVTLPGGLILQIPETERRPLYQRDYELSVLADHKRATLGFYKQQRKTIGITGDACPTYLISQFIIGAVVKRAEID